MSDRPLMTFEDWKNSLPEDRRQEIEEGARQELADHSNAEIICQSLVHAQEILAGKLGVDAEAVSEMSRQVDRYLIQLRKIVRKMGGRLDVVVRMPDRSPARLGEFHEPWARTIRYASQAPSEQAAEPPASST